MSSTHDLGCRNEPVIIKPADFAQLTPAVDAARRLRLEHVPLPPAVHPSFLAAKLAVRISGGLVLGFIEAKFCKKICV